MDSGGELPKRLLFKKGIIALFNKHKVLDIAGYIQDLLWDYECVIIPGFGGILGTYRSAEMVLAEHTIYPPSKSLAFNEYLTNNDGLLVNYICNQERISYAEASERIELWVKKTQNLLAGNEEIYLPKIGRFQRDVEKNLRFVPDTTVNYLSASYGLRKVIAEPVLRGKSAETIEVLESHRASYSLPRSNRTWAMAAVIILFLALGTVADLMYQGVNVRPLNLNAASVLGFLENFDKRTELTPEPKPSINKEIPELNAASNTAIVPRVSEESPVAKDTVMETINSSTAPIVVEEASATPSAGKKYYVIIGAYKKRSNFYNAQSYLQNKYAGESMYEDTSLEKRRIGFYAGDNYADALKKLQEARKDQQDYWLLVKK